MRPVFLTIEGLACFKDKQEIDLSRLDLFAISGPTGAGKSTVLDAMILALYGDVPRVSVQDRSEMISASRDRLAVRLDFNVGASRYRIARTLRRGGGQTVRLEKHDGKDFSINMADGVRPATEAIEKLLGLDVVAFKQAVVLPQGDFADFLKGKPEERRRMLRSLLRLDVYERMRERAQKTASAVRVAVDSKERVLLGEYAGVSEEALAALVASERRVATQLEDLRRQRDEAQHGLKGLREARSRTIELGQAETALAVCRASVDEMEGLRRKLDAASRAALLLSLLDEADRALTEATQAARQAELSRARRHKAGEALKSAEVAAEAAEKAAAAIPALREQSARLHQIVGRLPEAQRLQSAVLRGTEQLKSAAAAVAETRARIDEVREQKVKCEAAVGVAQASLRDASYDPALEVMVESVRSRALLLGNTRQRVGEARRDLARSRAELGRIESLLVALNQEAQAAKMAAHAAGEIFLAAEAALHRAHGLDAANSLRKELKPGDPCPVCHQTVASPPEADLNVEVQKAIRDVDDARKRHGEAEAAARAIENQATREEASAAAAKAALAAIESRDAELTASVAGVEAEVHAALSDLARDAAGPIEVWVESKAASLSEARRAHDRARVAAEVAGHALEKAQAEEASLTEKLAERVASQRKIDAELASSRGDLAALQAEVALVTQSKDPGAEAEGLKKQIESLESGLRGAGMSLAEARSHHATAESEANLLGDATEQAMEKATARAKRRDDAIALAGFADPSAVRASFLDESTTARLTEQVRNHDHNLHAAEVRVASVREELGETRVTADQLGAAEKQALSLDKQTEQAFGEKKALEGQVETMRGRVERSGVLRAQLAHDQAELRVHTQLATDLRSDKFQAYVLEEAFSELVQGASTRLMALTGDRYSLIFRDDGILVVDHDNADETRISDTLSGGETFLASLSLALELSDQVQRSAGAVNLDSLFIDEGFGTLDPDTLTLVSETIHSLQAGGRMVGIITHIPELRDEFAQQIIVTKHEGFSTVEVRAGS